MNLSVQTPHGVIKESNTEFSFTLEKKRKGIVERCIEMKSGDITVKISTTNKEDIQTLMKNLNALAWD